MRQPLFDVSSSLSSNNVSFGTFTKENIATYLNSPSSNEKNLRNASRHIYSSDSHYYRLIQYYANLFKWCYIILPIDNDPEKVKSESFKKSYLKTALNLQRMNIRHEFSKASAICLRDGVFYGMSWTDSKNNFFIQPINPDYCKLKDIVDGVYSYAIDMSQINESDLYLYPQQVTKMYQDYRTTRIKYQVVPDEISWCIKADETENRYSIPPWTSVLASLIDIENYKALQETSTEIENYKMIHGQVPTDSAGAPTIPGPDVTRYYEQLCNAVPRQIGVAVTPFNINSVNFDQSGSTNSIDTVGRSLAQFWAEVGSPAPLHGAANDTAGAIKLAIKSDEMLSFALAEQVQRLINLHLKLTSGSIKFRIQFLPVTVFNEEEVVKLYKEAGTYGFAKSLYPAALGLQPFDVASLNVIESEILSFDELTPLSNTHTMTSENEAGRPSANETDLSESGEETRDTDANENR